MQQPMYQAPAPQRPRRRRGGFGRFVRGYLMVVGAGATIAGLGYLLVQLFVEIDKWLPTLPPLGQ